MNMANKIEFEFQHNQTHFIGEGVVHVKMLVDQNQANWRLDYYECIPPDDEKSTYEYELPSTNPLAEVVIEFHYYRDYNNSMDMDIPNTCYSRCVKIGNYNRKLLLNIIFWDVNPDDMYYPELIIIVPNLQG